MNVLESKIKAMKEILEERKEETVWTDLMANWFKELEE